MRLIGFTGKMGSGKSTAIDIIGTMHGRFNIRLTKFAQPLYDMQEYIYQRIYPTHTRAADFTKDRKLLQLLGTDWGRETIGQNIWVDLWRDTVYNHSKNQPADLIVCDDVRFDNEAQAIMDLGGYVVKITSSNTEARINTKTGIANHNSEKGVDSNLITAIIENDGTLQQLKSLLCGFNKIHKVWDEM